MDVPIILTFLGILITVLAFVTIFILEDRRRTGVVDRVSSSFDDFKKEITASTNAIKQQVDNLAASSKLITDLATAISNYITEAHSTTDGPDFTAFVSNQWRIFDRMARYRHEKLAICRHIVSNHVHSGDSILLDSGSTTDQITSELIRRNEGSVRIFSNNVLAALHTTGTSVLRFSLLPGEFFQRSWAVYSEEAVQRIDQLGINLFIMAAAALRFGLGVMVRDGEEGNRRFKERCFEAFQSRRDTRLILAVDCSKLCEPTSGHNPVISPKGWRLLLRENVERMTLVTCNPPQDLPSRQRSAIIEQLSQFEASGMSVELAKVY